MKLLIMTALIPLTSFAQLSGKTTKPSWGGYWWSMSRAETALGWDDGAGRKTLKPSDVAAFTKCLTKWTKTCDKYSANQARMLSPLMKFDLYIYKRLVKAHGSAPEDLITKTAENELKIHYIDSPNHPRADSAGYAGKCNGWSYSTFDNAEPAKEKVLEGILFKPADIKAILATLYTAADLFVSDKDAIGMAVRADMSGKDYTEARNDVLPHTLIKALQQNIGKKKKPLLADMDPEEGVWNHPVFAYDVKITKKTTTTIEGQVTLTYADDQTDANRDGRIDIDGVFTPMKPRPDHIKRTLTFSAKIPAGWKDDFSKIKSSAWTGNSVNEHPDSLVLGFQDDWRESIEDYIDDEDMATEVNFELHKLTDLGNGETSAVDLLLEAYY
jgi:hypothetical protein